MSCISSKGCFGRQRKVSDSQKSEQKARNSLKNFEIQAVKTQPMEQKTWVRGDLGHAAMGKQRLGDARRAFSETKKQEKIANLTESALKFLKESKKEKNPLLHQDNTHEKSVLTTEKVIKQELLGAGGANSVYTVAYKIDKNKSVTAVFKPQQTKTSLSVSMRIGIPKVFPNFEARNIAAYKLSVAMGFSGIVPKAQWGEDQSGKKGLLMEKIPGSTASEVFMRNKKRVHHPEIRRQVITLQLFDYVCGQGDRHRKNYMIGKDATGKWRVTGIDNDQAFGKNTKHPHELFGITEIALPTQKNADTLQTALENLKNTAQKISKSSTLQKTSFEEITAKNKEIYKMALKINKKLKDPLSQDPKKSVENMEKHADYIFSALTQARKKTNPDLKLLQALGDVARAIEVYVRRVEDPQDPKKTKNVYLVKREAYVQKIGYFGVLFPPVIDEDMRDRLLSLTKRSVSLAMKGLDNEEKNAAWVRIQQLQEHVRILERQEGGIIKPTDWGKESVTKRLFPDVSGDVRGQERSLYFEKTKGAALEVLKSDRPIATSYLIRDGRPTLVPKG